MKTYDDKKMTIQLYYFLFSDAQVYVWFQAFAFVVTKRFIVVSF